MFGFIFALQVQPSLAMTNPDQFMDQIEGKIDFYKYPRNVEFYPMKPEGWTSVLLAGSSEGVIGILNNLEFQPKNFGVG